MSTFWEWVTEDVKRFWAAVYVIASFVAMVLATIVIGWWGENWWIFGGAVAGCSIVLFGIRDQYWNDHNLSGGTAVITIMLAAVSLAFVSEWTSPAAQPLVNRWPSGLVSVSQTKSWPWASSTRVATLGPVDYRGSIGGGWVAELEAQYIRDYAALSRVANVFKGDVVKWRASVGLELGNIVRQVLTPDWSFGPEARSAIITVADEYLEGLRTLGYDLVGGITLERSRR